MIAKRVEDLRSWQLTYAFKLAVYDLLGEKRFGSDVTLRQQICDSAASAVSHMEEGFARFYPKDHAKFVVGGRASLLECCGHLRDAVDRGHITVDARLTLDTLARDALREISGLVDYLQSPEAEENARRIKARRAERRRERERRKRDRATPEPRNDNPELRTKNPEPRTERQNKNREPGTGNEEPL